MFRPTPMPMAHSSATRCDGSGLRRLTGYGLDADWRHGPDDLHRALNATLPAAIAVLDLDEAAPSFHPRYDATSRRYVYTIYNAPVRHPLYARFALHVADPLDVEAMDDVEMRTGRKVVPVVATESVDEPVAGFGVKVPVAPAGKPVKLNVTALLKPFVGVMVTL